MTDKISVFEFRCILLFACTVTYFLPSRNELDYNCKVGVCIGAMIIGWVFSKQILRWYDAYHAFMNRLIWEKIFKHKEDKDNG
jgi:hypothetical protein